MTQHNFPVPPIRLEQAAADFVRTHGGHIMVRRSPRHGCCGGRVYLPVVNIGQPAEVDDYVAVQYEDIIIHLDRVLLVEQHSPVVIGLSRWWRWHELWVEEG